MLMCVCFTVRYLLRAVSPLACEGELPVIYLNGCSESVISPANCGAVSRNNGLDPVQRKTTTRAESSLPAARGTSASAAETQSLHNTHPPLRLSSLPIIDHPSHSTVYIWVYMHYLYNLELHIVAT